MSEARFAVGDADTDLAERLDQEISAFNAAASGHHDARMLSVAVRGDDGDLRGGLYGWTWGGCGYVDLLWVRDDQRGLGLGADLLATAEAGDVRYAALRDGILAGGATMRLHDGIAQLTGAATLPAHRRHGIQTALLSARLADAATAGCDVAVIIVQPGSKSQQNAQRQGFDLLYTRAVLVKQP